MYHFLERPLKDPATGKARDAAPQPSQPALQPQTQAERAAFAPRLSSSFTRARPAATPISRAQSRDPIDFKMDLGVVVIKSTEIGIKFAAAWAAAVVADKAKTADAVFNELMRMVTGRASPSRCSPASIAAVRLAETGAVSSTSAPPDARLHPPSAPLQPSAGQASPQNVDTLQPIPGGSWAVARMQDLFPRYQARVNDGSQPRVFWVHPLRVGLGILPVGLFTNGHTYFIGDMPGSFRLKPYTVRGRHPPFHFAARRSTGVKALPARGFWRLIRPCNRTRRSTRRRTCRRAPTWRSP